MLAILTVLALQAAPAAAAPERFSILVPVADEPCRPARKDMDKDRDRAEDSGSQAQGSPGGDVVVCGDPLPSQRLPLPNEAEPSGPTPSNRDLSGSKALASEGTPCAARQGGCTVGFGPPIVPMLVGAVGLVKDALKKHPDKTGRIPIPLDGPPGPAVQPAAGTAVSK